MTCLKNFDWDVKNQIKQKQKNHTAALCLPISRCYNVYFLTYGCSLLFCLFHPDVIYYLLNMLLIFSTLLNISSTHIYLVYSV